MDCWIQRILTLPPQRRGFHLITSQVVQKLPELRSIKTGLLNLFLQHTSASLTVNENASPEVRVDLESSINALVPEDFPYAHSLEGPDDMPAHIKSSLFGPSLTIPVHEGRLALGVWQGIYLCEHRDRGGPRQLVLTLHGEADGLGERVSG
ncbi:MAG: secondary thiamine-phosphate synthase enzyme YjbQ [Pirellulaceae bacterium]|nr:secondary thiamine-phosphate synthase enzyme YjbQ [Pirellulaceae bacterium]